MAKSDDCTRVQASSLRATLSGVRAIRATFRGAIGISLLLHTVAFASVWRALGTHPTTSTAAARSDVWVGTTVSVITEHAGQSATSSPNEKTEVGGYAPPTHVAPAAAARSVSPKQVVIRDGATARSSDAAPQRSAQLAARARAMHSPAAPSTPALADAGEPTNSAVSDLKKAMLDASNQREGSGGTFGAVGVDLRERRLPAAITRALPVAIGAQAGWWRGKLGALGTLKFEVTLDEAGKIQTVDIDDEASHEWASHIVRRVARLLAVGRYALPATTPGAQQRFELALELEQRPASTSITAEAGDAVDMGWEAPTASSPGKAHIQEAQGRTLRATLRVLPAVKVSSPAPARPSHSIEAAQPAD